MGTGIGTGAGSGTTGAEVGARVSPSGKHAWLQSQLAHCMPPAPQSVFEHPPPPELHQLLSQSPNALSWQAHR